MQKARCQATNALQPLVSVWFQVFSPSYLEYFSPFPHGTSSLSVSQEYLALADGAARFNGDFSGPHLLRILAFNHNVLIQDFHLLRLIFPELF